MHECYFSQGLKAVRESDGGTIADEGVQRLIRRRIDDYPEKANADMHFARSVVDEGQNHRVGLRRPSAVLMDINFLPCTLQYSKHQPLRYTTLPRHVRVGTTAIAGCRAWRY